MNPLARQARLSGLQGTGSLSRSALMLWVEGRTCQWYILLALLGLVRLGEGVDIL